MIFLILVLHKMSGGPCLLLVGTTLLPMRSMSVDCRKPALFPNLWMAHPLQDGRPTQLPPPITRRALDHRAAPAAPTFCLLLHGAYQNPQNGGFAEVKAGCQDPSLSTILWGW